MQQMNEQLEMLAQTRPNSLFYPNRIKYWEISMTEGKAMADEAKNIITQHFENVEMPKDSTPEQKKITQLQEDVQKL